MATIDADHIALWSRDADKRCGTCADDPENHVNDRLTFVCLNCRIILLAAEVNRLQRWKDEAMPVMDGLQELGRALDIPLGHSITGPDALAAVQDLQKSHESDGREIARLREEVRRARVNAAQTRLAQGVTEK